MAFAVVAVGTALYFVVLAFNRFLTRRTDETTLLTIDSASDHLWLWASTVVATTLFVLVFGLFRNFKLRRGGSAVAEMLGGRKVVPLTADPLEKRLVNVVQEMAIASGVPVPQVYVLDEDGINALAAGFTYEDAVVAVTRGALESFTREELQGVIAHEFSHILHADMRLNLRLISTVYGLICVYMAGRIIVGLATERRHTRRDRDGGAAIALVGLAVMLVGMVGKLCGQLITAAISRQREFLADASAVQFTRNPQGIASALRRIRDFQYGSNIVSRRAEEASHLFFGDPLGQRVFDWFTTHPPLSERIRRVDALSTDSDALATGTSPVLISPWIGAVNGTALVAASQELAQLSPQLREAAGDPFSATALLCSLVLVHQDDTATSLETVRELLTPMTLIHEIQRLLPEVRKLSRHQYLPLVELSSQTLHQLSTAQRNDFLCMLKKLTEADKTTDLFEYLLLHTVETRMERVGGMANQSQISRRSAHPLSADLQRVLSAVAHAGSGHATGAATAYRRATAVISVAGLRGSQLLPWHPSLMKGLVPAFQALRRTAPRIKEQIVEACAQAIVADKTITADEWDLMRVVCEALSCPLPLRVPEAFVRTTEHPIEPD